MLWSIDHSKQYYSINLLKNDIKQTIACGRFMWGHDRIVLCLDRCRLNKSLHDDNDHALRDWQVAMGTRKYSFPKCVQVANRSITSAPVAVIKEEDIVNIDHDPRYLLKGWMRPQPLNSQAFMWDISQFRNISNEKLWNIIIEWGFS
jgi:hypothetical protein